MRWSYKTVHYDLIKEGLLGNSFLDEAEVEKSLNEFGQAGWELVSIMETQDGVIAIFKQPIDKNIGIREPEQFERKADAGIDFSEKDEYLPEEELIEEDEELVTEYDIIEDEIGYEDTEQDADEGEDAGPYSIRIE